MGWVAQIEGPRTTMTLTMDRAFFAAWRKGVGLTQQELADKLGVNLSAIKKWEGGARKLPPFMGYAMAAIEADLEPVGKDHMHEVESDEG